MVGIFTQGGNIFGTTPCYSHSKHYGFFLQVIKRLRERGEPVKLFGESDEEALQRLKKVEMMAPEINRVKTILLLMLRTYLLKGLLCIFVEA